ncbi:hypothetical protein FACS189441_6120 [Betaproteobacteria bacterium]|nr:hypothetical protein FACS189441_6120 [Betaproteobacteria bacterium]
MSNTATKKILSLHLDAEIRNGLKDLRAYTEKIEQFIESQKDKIEECNKNEVCKAEGESEDIMFNIQLRLGYGRHMEIFTKSTIISIFVYFEFFLDSFCEYMHKYDKKLISPKDIHGSGICRSKTYLNKVLLINTSNLESEWEELVTLQKIRNFLVHSNGVVASDDAKTKLQKSIEGVSGVQLEEDHLKISPTYIKKMLATIERFLTKIKSQYFKNI